jgi:hypothetical protein
MSCDLISEFASHYTMRGDFATFSPDDILQDVIRDSLAHRSNMMLQTKVGSILTNADKAALFHDDWETDGVSQLPDGIKKRCGVPHAFHSRIGQWVPVHAGFNYLPDVSQWVTQHATTSPVDREIWTKKWIGLNRHIRINSPYSYCPRKLPAVFSPASIKIGNVGPHISDADLMLAFSVFGHIVDFHHPYYNPMSSRKKKAFYVFIEFYNSESVDAIMNDFNGTLYFMDTPITIERAGSRKTPDDMKLKNIN